jgi:dethiobiotin synthetase
MIKKQTPKRKPLFVTGIGTGVGKTIVSAVLCEQLQADYWKPVQSGDLENSDTQIVRSLMTNPKTIIFEEAVRLKLSASPHESAKAQGMEITPDLFSPPETDNQLLIEGAGGLFVPLSDTFLMSDLIQQFDAEVVLVARNYLGCINHTLLSIHALSSLGIPLKHLVFNGSFNQHSKEAILQYLPEETSWSDLPFYDNLTRFTISKAPQQL